jgi:hypothetical protein
MENVFIGTSDFNKIVESEGFFFDKTLFIKEFIDSRTEVDKIVRPRRFGKSTNLNILESFLSMSYSPNASSIKRFFENSLVGQDKTYIPIFANTLLYYLALELRWKYWCRTDTSAIRPAAVSGL